MNDATSSYSVRSDSGHEARPLARATPRRSGAIVPDTPVVASLRNRGRQWVVFDRLPVGIARTPHWALVLLVPALLGGCAANNKDMIAFIHQNEHNVSAIEYRVGIPDVVGISAPRALEIDGDELRIQPDGKITLRLLGEVKVAGMTAKEIAAKLEVLLSRYYVDPKVSVRILAYASKKYYVTGQASRMGSLPYTGRDTLLDAVVAAGVDYRSWLSRVKVIRPSHDGSAARTIQVDVNRMIKFGDWQRNILLEPDDIVYIPPTPFAWLGLRVRELLEPIDPALDAYTAPADLIYANDVYNNDYRGGRTGRRR